MPLTVYSLRCDFNWLIRMRNDSIATIKLPLKLDFVSYEKASLFLISYTILHTITIDIESPSQFQLFCFGLVFGGCQRYQSRFREQFKITSQSTAQQQKVKKNRASKLCCLRLKCVMQS